MVAGINNAGDAVIIDDRRNVVRDIGNVMGNTGLHKCGIGFFLA